MFKKLFVSLFVIVFLIPSVSFAGSFGKEDDPSGNPGEWYVGTTPSYVAPSKHPILFVHGLNSSSNTWWDGNDMYDMARQEGYETAFIDLYPTNNMWSNGSLLADKIEEMYRYFGEKIVVVAHSKGGIDTQTALVHYNAYPYVERVITLSSPHHGSQLADLAYSSWAGWLAGILGSKSDATYSLQTGYMDYFRSRTDQLTKASYIPFYTFGGTDRGRFGSSLFWGGLYLSAYGQNDGAVTVASSRLPYGTEVSVGDWNHTTIKEGDSTFDLFENYLQETSYFTSFRTMTYSNTALPAASSESSQLPASIVRGGEFSGKQKETFSLEEGVHEVVIDWISDSKATDIVLKNRNNKKYTSFNVQTDQSEYFNGAYHHVVTIPNPEAGTWTLEATADKKQSYLLNISIDSPLSDVIALDVTNNKHVKVKANDKDVKVKTKAIVDYYDKNGKQKKTKLKLNMQSDGSYSIPKLGEGVYNMTIEVDGKKGKDKFQRSIVKSIYVDNQGNVHYK